MIEAAFNTPGTLVRPDANDASGVIAAFDFESIKSFVEMTAQRNRDLFLSTANQLFRKPATPENEIEAAYAAFIQAQIRENRLFMLRPNALMQIVRIAEGNELASRTIVECEGLEKEFASKRIYLTKDRLSLVPRDAPK